MKNITVDELAAILLKKKGARPITFSAIVDTRARKTGNPYDQILKFSVVNGFTGHDYENSVNRQLGREGQEQDFNVQARTWGENVNGIVVQNGKKFYLRVRPLRTKKPIYLTRKGSKIERVEKDKIEKFLPPVYHAQNQGTIKEIVHRDYSFDSLRTISIDGEKFMLIR